MRGLLITEPSTRSARAFDPNRAYALNPRVALRPERFGALAYHYGNRRLNFLRSPDLVAVVEDLARHPSVDAALASSGVARARWPAFRTALAQLAASEFITPVTDASDDRRGGDHG